MLAPGNLQDMAEYTEGCRSRGIFCIFDPGQSLPAWDSDDLAVTIGNANLLVSNDYELGLIKNATGLTEDQLIEIVETIVTTKAELGSDVLTGAGRVTVPVVPTPGAVDPTGAGDAFRGGLIKGLVEGHSVERAVQMGTVCAHFAVQAKGTQEYSFTMDEFNATLEQQFGKANG